MSKEEKKKYKKRARRKVFGVPAGLCERAHRYYSKTMKHNSTNPNAKMSFFNEELKNNYWIGLIAKTSKIAPRHVRLVMMYFYASLYIIALTIIFAFQLQEYISENALF
jgi:phage shock protein PspC (stress-responsive transcriptional regulator)